MKMITDMDQLVRFFQFSVGENLDQTTVQNFTQVRSRDEISHSEFKFEENWRLTNQIQNQVQERLQINFRETEGVRSLSLFQTNHVLLDQPVNPSSNLRRPPTFVLTPFRRRFHSSGSLTRRRHPKGSRQLRFFVFRVGHPDLILPQILTHQTQCHRFSW